MGPVPFYQLVFRISYPRSLMGSVIQTPAKQVSILLRQLFLELMVFQSLRSVTTKKGETCTGISPIELSSLYTTIYDESGARGWLG